MDTPNEYTVDYVSGYVQDDWRVNSKFTLNYGVRFDYLSSYNLDVRGGTPAVRYFLSGNYDADEGMDYYNTNEVTRLRQASGLVENFHRRGVERLRTRPMLGGLILNLMPCVFPILAIKVVGFTRHADDRRVFNRRLHLGEVDFFIALLDDLEARERARAAERVDACVQVEFLVELVAQEPIERRLVGRHHRPGRRQN